MIKNKTELNVWKLIVFKTFHTNKPEFLNKYRYPSTLWHRLKYSTPITMGANYRKISLNRLCWRKRGLASNPLFIIPGFSLHFPWELSYGYLRFEGNGKIPLGRQGKRKGKERARVKKLQNILLLTVGFELMTSWLPDGRSNQLSCPDFCEERME